MRKKETVWTAGSSFPSARAIDYVKDIVDDDVFVGPAARGHRAPNSPGRTVVDDASERSDFPAGFLYIFCRARRILSLAALPLGSVASAVSHAARDLVCEPYNGDMTNTCATTFYTRYTEAGRFV